MTVQSVIEELRTADVDVIDGNRYDLSSLPAALEPEYSPIEDSTVALNSKAIPGNYFAYIERSGRLWVLGGNGNVLVAAKDARSVTKDQKDVLTVLQSVVTAAKAEQPKPPAVEESESPE